MEYLWCFFFFLWLWEDFWWANHSWYYHDVGQRIQPAWRHTSSPDLRHTTCSHKNKTTETAKAFLCTTDRFVYVILTGDFCTCWWVSQQKKNDFVICQTTNFFLTFVKVWHFLLTEQTSDWVVGKIFEWEMGNLKKEKEKSESDLLCILTSKRVFCMPFAGSDYIFLHFNIFFHHTKKKWKSAVKKWKIHERGGLTSF